MQVPPGPGRPHQLGHGQLVWGPAQAEGEFAAVEVPADQEVLIPLVPVSIRAQSS